MQRRIVADALDCRVSILMPVFETPVPYLEECWQSIQAQSFRAWELVLVDDGSTAAGTLALLEEIGDDPRVRLLTLDRNRGVAHALNAGLERCRAELVARMDADDKMLPSRLERQVAYLTDHPEVAILGTQMQGIDWETGELHPPTSHPPIVDADYIEHQRASSHIWVLNHPTAVFRRQAILDLGGYPDFRVAQDLALWLKAHRAGLEIHNLASVELHYRLHPDQVSTPQGLRHEEFQKIVGVTLG